MKEFYYAQEDTFKQKCKEMMVTTHRQFFNVEGHKYENKGKLTSDFHVNKHN